MTETAACSYNPSCLGLCEWYDCPGAARAGEMTAPTPRPNNPPNSAPPSLTGTLALEATASSKAAETTTGLPPSHERFSSFVDDDQLAVLSKGMTPANTSKSTKWALANFDAWRQARNKRYPEDKVPDNLLTSNDPAVLTLHLSRYALETRKENGEPYPPKTIHQLLCGLLRHMKDMNTGCPNFLDKQDTRFKKFQGTLDSHFHNLHASGLGREVKHARVLSKDDEEKLWKSGVLGISSPRSLQNAVFYSVGKVFSLRGGVEMRSLSISQIKRYQDPDRYVYTENVSKTNSGTFKKLHTKSKVVPVFACPEVGERCPVYLLDLYLSKLPTEAFEQDIFYLRPLENIPSDPEKPWYSSVPVGKNTLERKLAVICDRAGIQGTITNHSLRATSATPCTGVEYQKRSYRSELVTEALRIYERSDSQQHQAVSNILSSNSDNYTDQRHRVASRHSTTTSMSFPMPQSANYFDSMQPTPISFGTLYGCTINFNGNTPNYKPSNVTPNVPSSFNLTETEFSELVSDF